jgi:hypothetical protein
MPVINLNQLMLYMQNTNTSLDEALDRFNVNRESFSDDARKELERQLELHNKNVQRNQETAQKEADRIEEDYAGQE